MTLAMPRSDRRTTLESNSRSSMPSGGHPAPLARPASAGDLPRTDPRQRVATEACRLAQEIASLGFDVPVSEIRRPSRAETRACDARHVAMYLAHTIFQISLTKMALAFGRERTSVAHAVRRVEDRRDDAAFDRRLQRLEELAAAACRVADSRLGPQIAEEGGQ
ncbi:hypothetical protein E3C22_07070 [Jiella endophytica]|uniref:Chromosomal replication initiator DnaA C-terminal domain-containing protein n=1 Tax=Jiella endophytica TaxID=2558362 RepID=A0A4Y8RPY5_9HYPH|nr:helix-turn-helix domain-containing protein [Jiella endophytica]TFF25135.1 hypothetical protein E3C22_07070 [Jiella endophytica]